MGKRMFLITVAIFLVYRFAFAANQGLTSNGTVWVGTIPGSCSSTSTETSLTSELTVKSILYSAVTSSDSMILRDGTNTNKVMELRGQSYVDFGEGKVFRGGLYLNQITSGSTLFIYFK